MCLVELGDLTVAIKCVSFLWYRLDLSLDKLILGEYLGDAFDDTLVYGNRSIVWRSIFHAILRNEVNCFV